MTKTYINNKLKLFIYRGGSEWLQLFGLEMIYECFDHPALAEAIKTNLPILPLYIYNKNCSRKLGGAARWWLHHSLTALKKELKKRNAELILIKGDPLEILKDIDQRLGISHIFWHKSYDQEGKEQDQKIKKCFKSINCQEYNGSLLFEPENHKNKEGNFLTIIIFSLILLHRDAYYYLTLYYQILILSVLFL